MDQMRKDAKKKNKKNYAQVKKKNESILAVKEDRNKQVTYQRLFETGTKKLQGIVDEERQPRFLDNQDEQAGSVFPAKTPSKGTRFRPLQTPMLNNYQTTQNDRANKQRTSKSAMNTTSFAKQ